MSAHLDPPWEHPLPHLDALDVGVLQAFRRAGHANRQMFMRLMGSEQHGQPSRAFVLMVLGRTGEGMSQKDLAKTLHVTPPTVSVMLQKMEQGGLVERRADDADQRVTRLRITDKGRELSESISRQYADYVEGSLGKMTESDRATLTRLLNTFADKMLEAISSAPENQS